MNRLLSTMLLLGVCTACTTRKQEIPVWLLAPQEIYPPDEYLAAIGEGDSRRAAENRAAAGLARIFSSEIRATETLSETTAEVRGEKNAFRRQSRLKSAIQVDSNQNLLNMQFSEAFKDINGRIHIVAFLPRAETAEIYRGNIRENARRISALAEQAETSADPLRAYAFWRAAARRSGENDLRLEQLRIIQPQARKRLRLPYDPQDICTRAARSAIGVTFSVDIACPAVADAVSETLYGFGFIKNNTDPVLTVSGSAAVENVDLKRGELVFMRWTLNVEVSDLFGHPILSMEKSSREGHLSSDEARRRAERSLTTETSGLLREKLEAYFDRLTSAEKQTILRHSSSKISSLVLSKKSPVETALNSALPQK